MLATWANLFLRGPQSLDLVQRVTSNDASKLAVGDVQYSCLPNDAGRYCGTICWFTGCKKMATCWW